MRDDWGIFCAILLIWMSISFTDDKSTLVQVMAWCRQATSHYLNQCWPRSKLPYGVTRPQWVKVPVSYLWHICINIWLLMIFMIFSLIRRHHSIERMWSLDLLQHFEYLTDETWLFVDLTHAGTLWLNLSQDDVCRLCVLFRCPLSSKRPINLISLSLSRCVLLQCPVFPS